jgi:hypothetical protein
MTRPFYLIKTINCFIFVVETCSMSKFKRQLKPEFQEKRKDLEDMKTSELKAICEEYDIPTSGSKDEVVNRIKLYESGKYVKPVIYETTADKRHLIGVHLKDRETLLKLNKFVLSGEARFHHYASDFYYYRTQDKIKLI